MLIDSFPDFSVSSSICRRTENDDYSESTTRSSRRAAEADQEGRPSPAAAPRGLSRVRLENVPTAARLAILRRTRSMHKYPIHFHRSIPALPRQDIKSWLARDNPLALNTLQPAIVPKKPPIDFKSHFYRKAGNHRLVPKSSLIRRMKAARRERRLHAKALAAEAKKKRKRKNVK